MDINYKKPIILTIKEEKILESHKYNLRYINSKYIKEIKIISIKDINVNKEKIIIHFYNLIKQDVIEGLNFVEIDLEKALLREVILFKYLIFHLFI